jgi:hypothetical protein
MIARRANLSKPNGIVPQPAIAASLRHGVAQQSTSSPLALISTSKGDRTEQERGGDRHEGGIDGRDADPARN